MFRLAYNVFRPIGEVKGGVAIVHGMAEHRKRYVAFAEYLAENGYGVVTYDLPGHGESAGETLGYFGDDGWQELVDSADRAVARVKKEFPGVPVILFGHSMGTMISRCYLQKHADEVDAVVLSGAPNWQPAANAGIALGKVLRRLRGKQGHSKLMDQLVTGNFNKSVKNAKTPVDWLSKNEKNVQAYLEDPNCGFGFTIQGYLDELEGMRQMHQVELYSGENPTLPILFVAGQEDPCIGGMEGLEDSMNTLKEAGYKNITFKLYPNMRHEILQEEDRERVYRDIKNWIDQRIEAVKS